MITDLENDKFYSRQICIIRMLKVAVISLFLVIIVILPVAMLSQVQAANSSSPMLGPVASNLELAYTDIITVNKEEGIYLWSRGRITYVVEISSANFSAINSVVFTSPIPNFTDLETVTTNINVVPTIGSQVITVNIGTLTPSVGGPSSVLITMVVKATATPSPIPVIMHHAFIASNVGSRWISTTHKRAAGIWFTKGVKEDDPSEPLKKTFVFTLEQYGTYTATSITVTDYIPVELTYNRILYGSNSSYDPANQIVTWTPLDLGPGETITLEFETEVADNIPNDVIAITNTAVLTYYDPVFHRFKDDVDGVTTDLNVPVDLKIGTHSEVTSVNPVGLITYTIFVTNEGRRIASNFTLTVYLPKETIFGLGLQVKDGPSSYIQFPSVKALQWNNIGPLETNASDNLKIIVPISSTVPTASEEATLTATVEYKTDPSGSVEQVDDDHHVTIVAAPNLEASIHSNKITAALNSAIQYTIIVSNTGLQDTQGVVITTTMPDSLIFDSGDFSTSSDPRIKTAQKIGQQIVWELEGPLAASDSIELTVDTHLQNDPLTFPLVTSWVTATADYNVEDHPDPMVSDFITVTVPSITPTNNITVSIEMNRDVAPGDELDYTVTVYNYGSQEEEITVTVQVPHEVTVISTSLNPIEGVINGNEIVWGGRLISANSHQNFDYDVKVDDAFDEDKIALTTLVTASYRRTVITNLHTVTFNTELQIDVLTYTVTPTFAVPSKFLTYTILFENIGFRHAATNTTEVEAWIPKKASKINSDCISSPSTRSRREKEDVDDDLPFDVRQQLTCTLIVKLPDSDSFQAGMKSVFSSITITTDFDDVSKSQIITTPIKAAPQWNVTKEVYPSTVLTGTTLLYTITVKNIGGIGATNVVITDYLPLTYTEFVAATPGYSRNGDILTYIIDLLPVSSEETITVAMQVITDTDMDFTNRVVVDDDGTNDNNLSASSAETTSTVQIGLAPDLTVNAHADVGMMANRDIVMTYTITVNNVGTDDSSVGAVLTFTIPEHSNLSGPRIWTLPSAISPGASHSEQVTVTLTNPLPDLVEVITHVAEVFDPHDPSATSANNIEEDITPIPQAMPDLVVILEKINSDEIAPDNQLRYSVEVSNRDGNQKTKSVEVDFRLPDKESNEKYLFDSGLCSGKATVGNSNNLIWRLSSNDDASQCIISFRLANPLPPDASLEDIITVVVTDTNRNGGDHDPSNNVATLSYTIKVEPVVEVSVTSNPPPDEFVTDGLITYTVYTTSTGDAEARDVHIDRLIPNGTSLDVSSTSCLKESEKDNDAAFSIGEFHPEQDRTRQCSYVVKVEASDTMTQVNVEPEVICTECVENSLGITNYVHQPVSVTLDISPTTQLGQDVPYTITLYNPNGLAVPVTVIDTVDRTEIPFSSRIERQSSDIEILPLQTKIITGTTQAEDDDKEFTVLVTVNDLIIKKGVPPVSKTVRVVPRLQLNITDGLDRVALGEYLPITITLSTLDQPVERLVVTATLPNRVDFLRASEKSNPNEKQVITWTVTSLEQGQPKVLTIATRVEDHGVNFGTLLHTVILSTSRLLKSLEDTDETAICDGICTPLHLEIATVEIAAVGNEVYYFYLITNQGINPVANIRTNSTLSVQNTTRVFGKPEDEQNLQPGVILGYRETYVIRPTEHHPLENKVTVLGEITETVKQGGGLISQTHTVSRTAVHTMTIKHVPDFVLGTAPSINGSKILTVSLNPTGNQSPVQEVEVDLLPSNTLPYMGDDGNQQLDFGETWWYRITNSLLYPSDSWITVTAKSLSEQTYTKTYRFEHTIYLSFLSVFDDDDDGEIEELPKLVITGYSPDTAIFGEKIDLNFDVKHDGDVDIDVPTIWLKDEILKTTQCAGVSLEDKKTTCPYNDVELPVTNQAFSSTIIAYGQTDDGHFITSDPYTYFITQSYKPVLQVDIIKANTTAQIGDVFYYQVEIRHAVESDGSPIKDIEVFDNLSTNYTVKNVSSNLNNDNILEADEIWTLSIDNDQLFSVHPSMKGFIQPNLVRLEVEVQAKDMNENSIEVVKTYPYHQLVVLQNESNCLWYDFESRSDPKNSIWTRIDETVDYKFDITDGEYSVIVKTPNRTVFPDDEIKHQGDFQISVNAYWLIDGLHYGLIFALSDNTKSFYTLRVNSENQTYKVVYTERIQEVYDQKNLIAGFNPVIFTGEKVNHLWVERKGSLITVVINGKQVAEVSHDKIQNARPVGMLVESSDDPVSYPNYPEARFDDFVVCDLQ